MFRKLSIPVFLVLAAGVEAQKKVTAVDFCAVPTPEGSRLSVADGTGAFAAGTFLVGGAAFGTAAGGQISTAINGPIFFNPVGNYMSPLQTGACTTAVAPRIGTWEAACDTDFYEPVVQRLPDLAVAATVAFPTAAQLQAACEAAPIPTAAQTNVNNALCSSQISVTENTSNNKFSKLGTSAWYNYAPAISYTLIGGYMDQDFGPAVAPAGGAAVQRYCIYWPTTNAAVGNPAGGTNKWAKPVIDTITTTMRGINAPAGAARYADLAAALAAPAGLPKPNTVGPLTAPTFQETITVNYFKSYLPAGSL